MFDRGILSMAYVNSMSYIEPRLIGSSYGKIGYDGRQKLYLFDDAIQNRQLFHSIADA